MANYATLKAAINAVIKANGQREITGTVLNQTLNAMVNSLGANYQLAGVATPSTNPGTPDQNVFYLAFEAGTYTNFNATVLSAGISILMWNGSWSSQTFYTIDATPTASSNNLVSSGAVFDAIKTDGSAYDVSAHFPIGGPNNDGKFTLEYIISNANTLIPTAWRKGGMSIRFVHSIDNKYVQYRLMSDTFNTTPSNWQKQGAEVTVSQNTETEHTDIKIGDKTVEVASAQEVEIIETYVRELTNTSEPSLQDVFYISDKNGYVIAKIDKEGVQSIDFFDKNNESLIERIKRIGTNPSSFYEDTLYITDKNGFVVAKVNKDGIKAIKVEDKEGNLRNDTYSKFQIFSIGDSLSVANKWQDEVAQVLGCRFDAEGNIMPGAQLSTGGTVTYGGGKDSAFFRVKNLYDQNVITDRGENAIIIFENINDANVDSAKIGTIDDLPMVPTDIIETGIDDSNFNSEYLETVKSTYGNINAILATKTTTNGKLMTITHLPTVEGDIRIGTGWAGTGLLYYNIHVVPQATDAETLAYVINKILEYNYTGVFDFQGDEDNEVVFTCGNTYETFLNFSDIGNTGMTVTITDTDNAKRNVTRFFVGDSLDVWSNLDYWKSGSYLTFYRAYKSCIQYVIEKFPKAKVFIAGFPYIRLTQSSYLLPNGTYDYTSYKASSHYTKCNALYTMLKELADYYDIPYLDVANKVGINISNFRTYYGDNDPHPYTIGYKRIGNIVAREITKYL